MKDEMKTKNGFVKMTADARVLEIVMYGVVGWPEEYGGIDTGPVVRRIVEAGTSGDVDSIHIRVNSPGGDAFGGIAIRSALRSFPGEVRATVDGLAASAASVLLRGADHITMAAGSMLMHHQAAALAYGTAEDLIAQAEVLGKLDKQVAGIYAEASGEDIADVLAGMKDELWLTADEAVERGYADMVDSDTSAVDMVGALVPTSKAGALGDYYKALVSSANNGIMAQREKVDDASAVFAPSKNTNTEDTKMATLQELTAAFPDCEKFVVACLTAELTMDAAHALHAEELAEKQTATIADLTVRLDTEVAAHADADARADALRAELVGTTAAPVSTPPVSADVVAPVLKGDALYTADWAADKDGCKSKFRIESAYRAYRANADRLRSKPAK